MDELLPIEPLLIELLLSESPPLPLLEEVEDFADLESEDLAEVLEPDLALVPEVLLSEDVDLLLLLLEVGLELELEPEPEDVLEPVLPCIDEFMSELLCPELPDDMLPDWLDD